MYIAICDDDQEDLTPYKKTIQAIAKKRKVSCTVESFSSPDEFFLKQGSKIDAIDLVITDVFYNKGNGVDFAHELRENDFKGLIIFLSRSDTAAVDSYDVDAFNYILKVSNEESSESNKYERFEKVINSAFDEVREREEKYLLFNNIKEHKSIEIKKITFFESKRHEITVHYFDKGQVKTFSFIGTLTSLENRLASLGFFRVSRSFLINMQAVDSYTASTVKLIDGEELPFGRSKAREFKEIMKENHAA